MADRESLRSRTNPILRKHAPRWAVELVLWAFWWFLARGLGVTMMWITVGLFVMAWIIDRRTEDEEKRQWTARLIFWSGVAFVVASFSVAYRKPSDVAQMEQAPSLAVPARQETVVIREPVPDPALAASQAKARETQAILDRLSELQAMGDSVYALPHWNEWDGQTGLQWPAEKYNAWGEEIEALVRTTPRLRSAYEGRLPEIASRVPPGGNNRQYGQMLDLGIKARKRFLSDIARDLQD